MKHKSKVRQQIQRDVLAMLNTGEVISMIGMASPGDPSLTKLWQRAQAVNSDLVSFDRFIDYAWNISEGQDGLHTALHTLLERVRASKNAFESRADHREKRGLASALGLHNQPRSVSEILEATTTSNMTAGEETDIRIVWRERESSTPITLRSVLADTDCRPQPDAIVNETTGFYVVLPTESVMFLSKSLGPDGEIHITVELVVIRGVAQAARESEELYKWASNVIAQACCERRNVRPNHEGSIVQLGWNAGARHLKVWGLAKSWNKKVDNETMVRHDEDAVALLTVCWSLAKAHFPSDVMEYIEKCLEDSGVPRLATRNVREGQGYRLEINGKIYQFPAVTRAPPEAYMSQDYVAWAHTDKCWARYGIAWCLDRVVQKPLAGTPTNTRTDHGGEDEDAWPGGGGGNFVDLTLRVVVKQATGTLLLFQPEYSHGTTRLCGAQNRLCVISFSAHILAAYQTAVEGIKLEAGDGAGVGNTD